MGSVQLLTHQHIPVAEGFLSFAQEFVFFLQVKDWHFEGVGDRLIIPLDFLQDLVSSLLHFFSF